MVWACRKRHVDFVIRGVDHMKGSQITRHGGKHRKTLRETIKKDH